MSVVENIKSLCEVRGVSIPKLEKAIGLSRGSVYNWDTNSPSVEKVQKVADFFRVSLDRIIYGYDLPDFVNMVNYIKEDRTIERFAEDTGINVNELYKICVGVITKPPSIEVVSKIAASNGVDFIISEDDLLEAAGYRSDRQRSAIRDRMIKELVNQYEESGFVVRAEKDDPFETVSVDHQNYGTVANLHLNDFVERGFDLLDELRKRYGPVESHETLDDIGNFGDPQIGMFFKDFLSAPEERKEEMLRFWEFIREKEKGRKPGDRQGE